MKVTQSCRTLCDPMDCIVHGIFQARILEWVTFPFSRGSSRPRNQTQVFHIAGGFFTAEPQGKPKNTRVGSLSLLQGNLPNLGIEPRSPALQAESLPAEPQGNPKNTEVGSLSRLHGIFPTQESNRGLLHCRWMLYQLSCQGSPCFIRGNPLQYSCLENPMDGGAW